VSGPAVDPAAVERVVAAALDEDLGACGDVTTAAVVPAGRRIAGTIVARERLVLAGTEVARAVFRALGERGFGEVNWSPGAREGDDLSAGGAVAALDGAAPAVLGGERTALNLLQRLCGIATLTRACVEEVAGTGVALLDTRKTTPGLRALEKYAVAVGGGTNHRSGLFDRVLIKDNHLALAGGVAEAVRAALAAGHSPDRVEVEVDRPEQVPDAVEAGAGWILLDNMGPAELREAVALCRGRARLEASGGLRPGDLRRFAETGVDALSLGALTHSARSVDLALDLDPGASP
jgi:nicotinate-nucleotide pyrophosphorylase (carboxylating)